MSSARLPARSSTPTWTVRRSPRCGPSGFLPGRGCACAPAGRGRARTSPCAAASTCRALQSGDELPVGGAAAPLRFFEPRPLPAVHGACTVRVLPGPHCDRFTDQAWAMLCDERFRLSPESNRMGYRLSGPLLAHTRGADILSEATPAGAIQVPSSGQPILLMADRQTTGGYTIIGAVITADLPLAAQLAPGDEIRFAACTREEAIAALRDRMRWVV
jgi:antagonist of KipI